MSAGRNKMHPEQHREIPLLFLGNLKFIDSLNFMMSSLDVLVKGSTPEDMKVTEKACEDSEKRKLLLKKGIYPYEYMDSFERFHETGLSAKEEFFSKLARKGIIDEEYVHAKKVWIDRSFSSTSHNTGSAQMFNCHLLALGTRFKHVCTMLFCVTFYHIRDRLFSQFFLFPGLGSVFFLCFWSVWLCVNVLPPASHSLSDFTNMFSSY